MAKGYKDTMFAKDDRPGEYRYTVFRQIYGDPQSQNGKILIEDLEKGRLFWISEERFFSGYHARSKKEGRATKLEVAQRLKGIHGKNEIGSRKWARKLGRNVKKEWDHFKVLGMEQERTRAKDDAKRAGKRRREVEERIAIMTGRR